MAIPVDPTNIKILYTDCKRRADISGLSERLGPDGWFMMGFAVAAKQSEYDESCKINDMAEKVTSELINKLTNT